MPLSAKRDSLLTGGILLEVPRKLDSRIAGTEAKLVVDGKKWTSRFCSPLLVKMTVTERDLLYVSVRGGASATLR
jgi:hypothetical protein